MISLEKEMQVRTLLKAGLSGNEISRVTKVSTDAVYNVRKMVEAIAELTPGQRKQIRTLLNAKVPVGAIEMQTRIPRGLIKAVRRYYFLHSRTLSQHGPNKCPTCGCVKTPVKTCEVKRLPGSVLYKSVNRADVITMYRVVEDIVALGDSGVIAHPLFYCIVTNARTLLEKISDKSEK